MLSDEQLQITLAKLVNAKRREYRRCFPGIDLELLGDYLRDKLAHRMSKILAARDSGALAGTVVHYAAIDFLRKHGGRRNKFYRLEKRIRELLTANGPEAVEQIIAEMRRGQSHAQIHNFDAFIRETIADAGDCDSATIAKKLLSIFADQGAASEIPLTYEWINPNVGLSESDWGGTLIADATHRAQMEKFDYARKNGLDNDDIWWREYRSERINKAIAGLPAVERRIVEECELGEKTLVQIAEESGYSYRHVKRLHAQAIVRLGKHLVDWKPIRYATSIGVRELQRLVEGDTGTSEFIEIYHQMDLENLKRLVVDAPSHYIPGGRWVFNGDRQVQTRYQESTRAIIQDWRTSIGRDVPRDEYEEILTRLAGREVYEPYEPYAIYVGGNHDGYVGGMWFTDKDRYLDYLEARERGLRQLLQQMNREFYKDTMSTEVIEKLNAKLDRLNTTLDRMAIALEKLGPNAYEFTEHREREQRPPMVQ